MPPALCLAPLPTLATEILRSSSVRRLSNHVGVRAGEPVYASSIRASGKASRGVSSRENFHPAACLASPPGASAVVLNVAIDGAADSGFVTVYPTGVTRPPASSINVDGADQTIANLVTVPIGTGGSVDVYSLIQTDLVADVQGYYVTDGNRAGRSVHADDTDATARHTREDICPSRAGGGERVVLDQRLPTRRHYPPMQWPQR